MEPKSAKGTKNENAEKRLCARCGQPERRHALQPSRGPEVWQRLVPPSPEGAWLCPKFVPSEASKP